MEVEMVAKGNLDKHRRSFSGMKVVEESKWGRDTARARYGKLDQVDMTPKEDPCYPQFKEDQPSPGSKLGDHKNDWIRGRNEDGRPPNFDRPFMPRKK
jgi:hypothetical protein